MPVPFFFRCFLSGVLCLCLSAFLPAAVHAAAEKAVLVKLETSMGDITLQLDPKHAPATTENFLRYVKAGHYDGSIFHRVIRNFMIQGGGLEADMKEKATKHPIRNEANNGLHNKRYTIAMARTSDPHSATAQFFINTANNAFLDYKEATDAGYGYAVFGKVIAGKDVVDKIERVSTTSKGMHEDVPISPIVIRRATVLQK
ncbi:MAG: peptidyl-prolyl cis-trans isomerase [Desulfovibrio sp.]|nr:peptidyl-prolyl cis-trans isomerase [Desulfovibrio sp.]